MTWAPAQIASLPGGRLHLQHGPIDLVIGAEGAGGLREAAYAAAAARFQSVLGELVEELPLLRRPLEGRSPPEAEGRIARRMIAACWPHRLAFITPMAAVAGSVADETAEAMLSAAPDLSTLYVNNGGDIALHVAAGQRLRIGLVPDLAKAAPEGVAEIGPDSGVRGVATSGWRGRSFSRGIADAVTVLAGSAAAADAAATIIANAVDADHPAVARAPARALDPDSDLGGIAVTTDVGRLPPETARAALALGAAEAEALFAEGRIAGAMLALQGGIVIVGGQATAARSG
jgi:uncharacterized protein